MEGNFSVHLLYIKVLTFHVVYPFPHDITNLILFSKSVLISQSCRNAFLALKWAVKPVFHWRIFSHEATFSFCLNVISSTWFQPKAQGQREKVASRENIR